MTAQSKPAPRLRPRWFVRTAWATLADPFRTLDRYAALRSFETAVVVIEPRPGRAETDT